jgi:hypothetical protein
MLEAAIGVLAATDQELEQKVSLWSLCPGRPRATPLASLGEQLLEDSLEADVVAAFCEGLSGIARGIARNFPGNLFWDLDYLARSLLEAARTGTGDSPSGGARLRERVRDIAALQDLFSHASTIQFRYAHDFLYGFDWAKWVARAPETRAHVAPFDAQFLHRIQQRGRELYALIAQDDRRYPQLPAGRDRNPFGFCRDPEPEERLHRDLAAQNLLPLAAWDVSARPDWSRPYAELRERRAHALGL